MWACLVCIAATVKLFVQITASGNFIVKENTSVSRFGFTQTALHL